MDASDGEHFELGLDLYKVSAATDQQKIWHLFLWLLIAVQTVLFLMLGLWRHWGYLTSINDLGCFDQVVWGAANGLSLVNTSNFSQPIHWLGFHFQPVLYLFVFLYKILPSVNWFIVAQSLSLSVTAWLIFRIACIVTGLDKTAFLWSFAYLCNPFLLNAAAWDFHPQCLAVPFFALGLLAVVQKRPFLLLIVSIVVISCKEHFGIAVVGFGLLYWIRNRNWVVGVGFVLLGMISIVLILGVIMPSLSPTGQQVMLSVGRGTSSRYGWLGGSIQEIITNFIDGPLYVLQRVFLELGGLNYLFLLFLPVLFFPLAALLWLLPAGGDILVNLLSGNPMPRGIFSYHSVTIIPVLVVAAIHGSNHLTQLPWYKKRYSLLELSGFVLFINLGLGYLVSPFPLPGAMNIWQPVNLFASKDNRENQIQEIVGDASLSVQSNIGAHFSRRALIYRYPQQLEEVDFIVLRLESPTKYLLPHEQGAVGTLAYHLQMNPEQYLDSVEKVLRDERYSVVFWDSPWLVMGRNEQSQEATKPIYLKIKQLHKEWLGNGI